MKIFCVLLFCVSLYVSSDKVAAEISPGERAPQTEGLRVLCKEAQTLEGALSKLGNELVELEKKEKSNTPVIKNIREILTKCFIVLYNILKFPALLTISQVENKNDFIRSFIIIKNFEIYFHSVSTQLNKNASEITQMMNAMIECKRNFIMLTEKYKDITTAILSQTSEMSRNKEESITQNIVYHIATKSKSIEELDAELESENAIGVLKNTRISTALALVYPVKGRIVSEFGDKGKIDEMLYYISFACAPYAIVTSPAKGLVVFSGKFLNYGNMVIISNGDYRVFLYEMDSVFVTAGDVVEIGDYIGRMGSAAENEEFAVIKMELRKSGEPLDPRYWLLQTLEKKEAK